MRTLVRFEYRKLWNRVSVAAVIAMCMISTLHTFIYLNMNGQWRAIDTGGQIVSGLSSYRILKEASKDIKGTMDGEYLRRLKEQYAVSEDKRYLDEHRGFLGTGGMTKYMYPNYFINYAYYSVHMSNGNDKIGLDYDFLDSEAAFYRKYREAVKEQLLYENQYMDMKKFTDSQMEILDRRLAEIETPVSVSYYQGISNFMNWYNLEYPLFFIVLAFAFSGIYAKDSTAGVNELTLSTKGGRKRDFRARWIAGNLFAVSTYLIFTVILLLEHGAVATLEGLGASAQTYWFSCIFNISVGTGMILKITGGLFGALVFTNWTMLLSCIFKNVKPASAASALAVVVLVRLSDTYKQIKLLSPLQFGTDAAAGKFFFLGNALIPYIVIAALLSVIYIGVSAFLLGKLEKKYCLVRRWG